MPAASLSDLRYSKRVTMEKLKKLLAEYGNVAIYTYLVIWVLTLLGFALAISLGWKVESAGSGIGLAGAAWLATKLTQPLRIAGTLALTPFIAAAIKKLRRKPEPAPAPTGEPL